MSAQSCRDAVLRMSRREQQALLIKEARSRVDLTPMRGPDVSADAAHQRRSAPTDPDRLGGTSDCLATTVAFSKEPEASCIATDQSRSTKTHAPQAESPLRATLATRAVVQHSPETRTVLMSSALQSAEEEIKKLQAANLGLTLSLEDERSRRKKLEKIVEELSETVHLQTVQLEQSRSSVRQLTDDLVQARSAPRTTLPQSNVRLSPRPASRPQSPARVPGKEPQQRIPAQRTGSPSISRPTASSFSKCSHAVQEGFGSEAPRPSSASRRPSPDARPSLRSSTPPERRTASPFLARQQLATAAFLKATSCSSIRAGDPVAPNGPARPRLSAQQHGGPPVPAVRSTTIIAKNGIPIASASPAVPRRITPGRERVEAALARMTAPRLR